MPATANHISRRKGFEKDRRVIEDTYQSQVDTDNDVNAAIAAVEAITAPAGYSTASIYANHINRNPRWFEVKAIYEIKSGQGGGETISPLDRPSILNSSYEEWQEEYFIDAEDEPVVNTAKDRFESMPTRRAGTLNLQITKNFAALDVVGYDAIKFTTNSAAVTIKGVEYAANTLLFLPPSAQEVYEQVGTTEYHYFQVTFRLAADVGKHEHKISNRGFKQLVDGASVRITVEDDSGRRIPVETPWPLDETGAAKDAGDAADVLTFVPYGEANWGIDFN